MHSCRRVINYLSLLLLFILLFYLSLSLLSIQELCRQHMASKSSLCRQDCLAGVSGSMAGSAIGTGAGGRRGTDTSRVSSVSSQFSDGPQHSPSSTHSSTPSWSEEPAQSNMDISTGHMILVSQYTVRAKEKSSLSLFSRY